MNTLYSKQIINFPIKSKEENRVSYQKKEMNGKKNANTDNDVHVSRAKSARFKRKILNVVLFSDPCSIRKFVLTASCAATHSAWTNWVHGCHHWSALQGTELSV